MPRAKRDIQYGALPFDVARDGVVRVLLVTSRGTGRWIIPKGWPMRGKTPARAAAQEAFEEAGVVGKARRRAIGAYDYDKVAPDGGSLRCTVQVFPLAVRQLVDDWPEAAERRRQWFEVDEAAGRVDEPGLKAIIAAFRPQASTTRSGEELVDQEDEGLESGEHDGGNDHRRKRGKQKAEDHPDAVPLKKR